LSINAFPKRARLNKSLDFKDLFRLGKKVNSRYFALYLKKNSLTYARLGIVLAKKSVRFANDRNQIKRIIRESFRQQQQLLAGFDILVVGYHQLNMLKKAELRELIDHQWQRLTSTL
jgi:ribonuclease P protein component